MTTKKYFLFFYFIISFSLFANDNSLISLKDLGKINKGLEYDRLLNIKDGKIELEQLPKRIFLFSNEKYYTNIQYSAQVKEIGDKNKRFLESWLNAKYSTDNSLKNGDINTNVVLLNNQTKLFYKEILISDNGKLYNFIIQKPLADKMQKELTLNTKIQIEFIFLGKNITSNDDFFIITNFSKNNLATKTVVTENDYITAKKMIEGEKYDAALLKLNSFLTKYPNHLEAKKDVCLTNYLKSLKTIKTTRSNIEFIRCYENLARMYDNEGVYYTLASLYYSDNVIKLTDRQNNIIKYTDKAINLLKDKQSNENSKIIYYNALYLRGLTKIEMNNKDGLIDLQVVQDARPDLVNIDLFIK
jgi:hypothetical protein